MENPQKTKIQSIAVLGDSIAYGMVDSKGGFATRLKLWFESLEPNNNAVYNLGIGGETTESIKDRMVNEIEARDIDLIVINLGINDCRREESIHNPPIIYYEQFKSNVSEIIDSFKDTHEIIWVGMNPIDQKRVSVLHKERIYYQLYDVTTYEIVLSEICEEKNINYIGLVSSWFKLNYSKYLYEDGLHPNDLGHEYIFNRVKNMIEEKYL